MTDPAYMTYAPVAGDAVKSVQDIGSGDIGALAGDVGSFASDAGDVLSDPLNALISAGLGFLMDVIHPLHEALETVTGHPDALDQGKDAFAELGQDIAKMADELNQITQSGFQNWTGPAKDAATQNVQTFVQGVQGTANNAEDISQLLDISGTLMEAAYNLVMSIISDVIEWLIVTWVAALAAEIPTCGASTAVAGAATAGEVSVGAANAAEKVEQATSLVERISSIFRKIMSKLKDIKSAEKALRAGKDLHGVKDVKSAADAAEEAEKTEKAAKGASKSTSLMDKAKNLVHEKVDGYLDEHWNHPKEDLHNLINNPQGRLQEMAHNRTSHMVGDIKDAVKEQGKEVVDKAVTTFAGNLLDTVAPSDDPVSQARHGGPDGLSQSGQIDQDLQG